MEVSRVEIVICILMLWAAVAVGFPRTIHLERAASRSNQLSHLLAQDRARHGRLLKPYDNIPLEGNVDQYGLYYTRVQVGTPPREFILQIDTGSDTSWISCSGCNGCPKLSNLPINLSFYDPKSSSTASLISCLDHRCESCSSTGQCNYTITYQDTTTTSGFLVSNLLQFGFVDNTSSTIYRTPFFFGCSMTRAYALYTPIVDGILGFGKSAVSVISQLAREGMPKQFAHCLREGNKSGGLLVLGDIMEPGIVYTPLIQSKNYYSISLQSISVAGQLLDIDPSVFTALESEGTLFDSGSTYTHLPDAVFHPFADAITAIAVSRSAETFIYGEFVCYNVSSKLNDTFPPVSINFAGSASLVLRPQDYLQKHPWNRSHETWCINIVKSWSHEVTVIGDSMMRDKLIVYDLEGERIGWVDHNCLLPVNGTGFQGGRTARRILHWITYSIIVLSLCIIVIGSLMLLWRYICIRLL